ncbi:MAG: alpha/beta hydrolase [Bacteroidales bacterium]|nr:alpha/beta hydrolase [Bacteroidales bacterium]
MKKTVLAAIAVAICPLCHAQWWQAYSEKTGLVLSLHMADSAAEIYSPLQTADPLSVSQWHLGGDTLTINCKNIGFKTVLHRREEGWNGYWKQGMVRETIVFGPADTLFQPRRPQTPQPPYSFVEETIATDYVDSHGDSIHLEGTLTLPQGHDPSRHTRYPCLMLVSGSGQQNRDEELFAHRPFLVLADYLAHYGIATFRYDDRGAGASTGPLDSATTLLFAEDAEALFNVLTFHPHIDRNLLGIGGHSEGGAIAPMIAARNKNVKFVVMLAGQGCTGLEVMVQQNEALFRSRGVSARLCKVRGACMHELLSLPAGATVKDYQAVIARHTEGLAKTEADSIGLAKGMAYTLKQQIALPWMQTFLHLDPARYLPKVKVPVLALGGSRDCQVVSTPNLQRIKELSPKAEVCELSGLNHLFQHCQTGTPSEYIFIEETFAEEAMKLIKDYILGLR